MADDATNRDGNGRFGPGNRGGPGRPKGSGVAALRRAACEAVEPEHLRAIMRKATMLALGAHLGAARFVMDYTIGKPAQAPPAPVEQEVRLPALRSAADCNRAVDTIVVAFCDGVVDVETMKALTDTVAAKLKAIEANELEQRIAELEKAASAVAPPHLQIR
ncbi:MAG: hypothetical protein U1E73_03070 [Planctomycetota bacterium]